MNVINKAPNDQTGPAHIGGLRLLISPQYSITPRAYVPGLLLAPLREIFSSRLEGSAPEQGKSFLQASIQKP